VIALIAALDRNFAIGREGAMPWHLPDDLKRFKQLTLGKPVLMGRKTALSIGRALPGRPNFVLTRSGVAPYAGQVVVSSVDEALRQAGDGDLMVIGGGEIYTQTLPLATHLHLTWIDTAVSDADAFFPQFDPREWDVVAEEAHAVDARHEFAFRFTDYRRRG
jgi:dihydrofolate reductase